MNVKNRKCIRNLSFKSLWASRKRNVIAVIAIALTTVLFTSLFTVVLSMNSSYETYNFRQVGGYCHGSFKDVTAEQAENISQHFLVKDVGERKIIGVSSSGVFAKVPAEISYMDENCTKWSYAEPSAGREPESGKEIAMDTEALKLLGVEPKLGAEITFTYTIGNTGQSASEKTDTFTLVGYWEYDPLIPVHYINISEEYANVIEEEGISEGMDPFRTDLNVMMNSSVDIRGQMEQVDTDLGYTWETVGEDNSVCIGVNWGYTTTQLATGMDAETILAIIAFLTLVIFTGYLIIYNIFQISVTGDIRFYGLLKTIGVTSRQLRRMIRQQALVLCTVGIPIGILLGYGVGAILTPIVLAESSVGASSATISTSPLIFIASALFSLITVLISCARPGRIAAKVSPIEATRYTENTQTGKKSRNTRGAKVYQMAFANLGRNKSKTSLVIISLALSVVLLNVLYAFVGGFNMEKYLENQTCADFIVSSTDYFRYVPDAEEYIPEDMITEIETNITQSTGGCGYTVAGTRPQVWMTEEAWKMDAVYYVPAEVMEETFSQKEHRGDLVSEGVMLEGLDEELFDKLVVVEGDLTPMLKEDSEAIALVVNPDEYGNSSHSRIYPAIGEKVSVTYQEGHDVDYTVCAYVEIPYSMSYRYRTMGYEMVLPVEKLVKDSGREVIPLFYLFDTPDEISEAEAEKYLANRTAEESSAIMYESKETLRTEFENFQNVFLLVGGLLCIIIGFVGVLNFFNAIMTGILSRRREFAVLQSVGMTNKQLKKMLIFEGLFYAFGSIVTAMILSVLLTPLIAKLLENMFWFFSAKFTIAPVLAVIPVFALLGWLIPAIIYKHTGKHSIVERIREAE